MNQLQIEKELTGCIGKELICPDGKTRTLKVYEVDRKLSVSLYWTSGEPFTQYSHAEFVQVWPKYDRAKRADAPVDPAVLAELAMPAQIKEVELQANTVLPTSNIITMMEEQMKKVASGNPAAVAQANAMANLAKQVIEAGKLKLSIMRTIHEINQPAKP